MAQAVHLVEGIDSAVSMNSTTFATRQTLTAAELAGAGFQNNDEALILFWALMRQANAATEQVWRLTYDGSVLTNAAASPRRDSFGTVNTGRNVGWLGWVDLATLADLDFDNQRQGTSANVTVERSRLCCIRLSDFGVENTDWYRALSSTNVAHSTTYSGTDRASITWTPDEVTDWIVLMQVHIALDATNVNAEARAFLDGSTVVAGDWSQEGGATTEEWSQWCWGRISSLSMSSHTVAVQTRDDSGTAANDHRESRLFIFKANKWPDLFVNIGSTPQSMASNADVQVATITDTVSVDQNALIVGNARMITGEAPAGGWMWVRQGGSTVISPTTGPSAVAVANWANQDTTDEMNALWLGYLALTAGAQDLDLFMRQSGASTRNVNDPKLLVWGLEVVAAVEEPELEAEAASETDTPTDASMLADPLLVAESVSETDTPTDAALTSDPVLLADPAGTSDTSQDATLITEVALTTELATESDIAFDATLEVDIPAVELDAEPANETDVAIDAILLSDPLFIAEPAAETDAAIDAVATVDPVFIAEAANESDGTQDAEFAVDPFLVAEEAAETDQAFDAVMLVAPVLLAEPATETDDAIDAVMELVNQPELSGELATETDVAFDAVMEVEPSFIAEQAVEIVVTSDASMATEQSLFGEVVEELVTAMEAVLVSEEALLAELVSEIDSAFDALIGPNGVTPTTNLRSTEIQMSGASQTFGMHGRKVKVN